MWRLWKENKGEQFIDRGLDQYFLIDEPLRWINIALLCVQEDPQDRPTMSTVVFVLEGQWSLNLPTPLEPAQLSSSRLSLVFDLFTTTGDTTTVGPLSI